VTHKRDTGEVNVFPNPKVGTRRYMAPEILDERYFIPAFVIIPYNLFKILAHSALKFEVEMIIIQFSIPIYIYECNL